MGLECLRGGAVESELSELSGCEVAEDKWHGHDRFDLGVVRKSKFLGWVTYMDGGGGKNRTHTLPKIPKYK